MVIFPQEWLKETYACTGVFALLICKRKVSALPVSTSRSRVGRTLECWPSATTVAPATLACSNRDEHLECESMQSLSQREANAHVVSSSVDVDNDAAVGGPRGLGIRQVTFCEEEEITHT